LLKRNAEGGHTGFQQPLYRTNTEGVAAYSPGLRGTSYPG